MSDVRRLRQTTAADQPARCPNDVQPPLALGIPADHALDPPYRLREQLVLHLTRGAADPLVGNMGKPRVRAQDARILVES